MEGMKPDEAVDAALFRRLVTPHADAAWNLARWLLRRPHDADDVMQESYLRAFRFIGDYRGGDAKSWFLAIVRNCCHDAIKQSLTHRAAAIDERADMIESDAISPPEALDRRAREESLRRAIDLLPVEYREVLILREFESLSYKQIAEIAGVPMGTVMSRLARAREKLVTSLAPEFAPEGGSR